MGAEEVPPGDWVVSWVCVRVAIAAASNSQVPRQTEGLKTRLRLSKCLSWLSVPSALQWDLQLLREKELNLSLSG